MTKKAQDPWRTIKCLAQRSSAQNPCSNCRQRLDCGEQVYCTVSLISKPSKKCAEYILNHISCNVARVNVSTS